MAPSLGSRSRRESRCFPKPQSGKESPGVQDDDKGDAQSAGDAIAIPEMEF